MTYRSRLTLEVVAILRSFRSCSIHDSTTMFWLSPTSVTTALSRHARAFWLTYDMYLISAAAEKKAVSSNLERVWYVLQIGGCRD